MGGGQRINKIVIKDWDQIDWKKSDYFRFCLPIGAHVKSSIIKHNELVLKDFDETSGILTYYKLPPIIHRIADTEFLRGRESVKRDIKDLFGIA